MTEGEHRLWRRGNGGGRNSRAVGTGVGVGRKGREWHLVLAVE